MLSAQKPFFDKMVRQAYVHGIYRWLVELAFLFSAFSAFPEYKWPIGLGLLVFSAGIVVTAQVVRGYHKSANVLADAAERKTRHAVVHAAELAARGQSEIAAWGFWAEVDRRVAAEQEQDGVLQEAPAAFWKQLMIGTGALIWQLGANLLGIALVVGITGG